MTRVPNAFPVAATASAGSAPSAGLPPRRSPRVIGRALVALTKPRIIELLLVTTVPTMLLAQRGLPSVRLILVTLVGGTLAAGSANTINCYIDRDIDAVMKRTSRRPLVVNGHGTIKPWEALAWGILLGAGATLLLGLMANWLAASLADTAILFYIFVYTLLLKRRSPTNIVIGGAAGCFPVLVGWAAVTGTVAVPAIVLFAVIFLWTPPHFWALAMKFRKDYAAANIPMLPVVASPATVVRKILWYSYAMVAATLALIPYAGWIYGVFAAALGVWFLAEAHQLNSRVTAVTPRTEPVTAQPAAAQTSAVVAQTGVAPQTVAPQTGVAPQTVVAQTGVAPQTVVAQTGVAAETGAAAAGSPPAPMRLFHLSIAYLTLLFAAVAVTALLPWGRW